MLIVGTALVAALIVLVAGTVLALSRAISRLGPERRAAAPKEELPALLVIRPVRGVDHGLEANLAAALTQEYPGRLETLFVVDEESDPAVPLIRRAIAVHRSSARIVVAGRHASRTGKLHAMIQGMHAARQRTGLLCFADSDTRPGHTLLRDLARVLVARPSIGAAFARGICPHPPQTPWDVAHSVMLDGLYGPQAALTMARHGSLPFIMGQTMVLRRTALRVAGGLEGSEGQLVDDMHIGRRIFAAGYSNVLCMHPVPLIQAGLSWAQLHALTVRWITYSRTGIPFWPFNAPVVFLATVLLGGMMGAGIALALGTYTTSAALLACALSSPIALELLRRRHGGGKSGRFVWVVPVFLALLPFFFVRAILAKSVEWRGRRYVLDRSGLLDGAGISAPSP